MRLAYFPVTVSPCLQDRVDYQGNDYSGDCSKQPNTWKKNNPVDCINLCQSVVGCTHFTWVSPENGWAEGRTRCCLKRSKNLVTTKNDSFVSGVLANCEISMNNISKNKIFFLFCLQKIG